MREALLLIAHGSRRDASNDEVRHLTTILRERAADRFEQVDCAFLELAYPSIPEGIELLLTQGIDRIFVLPYFLAAGRHVTDDIPAALADKRAEHPEVDIEQLPYLGAADGIVDLLLSLVERR